MAFRRKMHDGPGLVLAQQGGYQLCIADVAANQPVPGITLYPARFVGFPA